METEMRVEQSEHIASFGTPTTDINEILALLQQFYTTKDSTQRETAHNKLTALQASPYIWEICFQLLDKNISIPEEVQFFAANTIYHKINESWQQLDTGWLENTLRPKLFDLICVFSQCQPFQKLLVERLSLALAAFAIHSIPSFWPNAIEQMIQFFFLENVDPGTNKQKLNEILFRILAFIPEEYSVLAPQQDRAKLNSSMTQAGPVVFKFLHSLLVSEDIDLQRTLDNTGVLNCFTSWTLHTQTSLLELDNGKEIIEEIISSIGDCDYCGPACSAIAATFNISKSENYRNTVIYFISRVAQLKSAIYRSKDNDEIENAIKIYSLVVNFAENHSRLFLNIVLNHDLPLPVDCKPTLEQDILEIIKIILECSDAPGTFAVDEKYSDMTFPFWFTFLENFYYYPDSYNDKICEIFHPLLDELLAIFLRKLRYPSANVYSRVWTDEQRELFRCYRQDLGDNISLLINFPRSRPRILRNLRELFMCELNHITSGPIFDGERLWQGLEAAIFSLKSIAESIAFDENKYVPEILQALDRIPFDEESLTMLFCSSCEMISSFSDWLYAHGTYLASALGILFKGITSPSYEMRLFSTLSLKDLTSECQAVLRPYAMQIVTSCSEAVHRPQQAVSTDVAVTCEKARLMHTIGASLPMCPPQVIIPTLSNLITPFIDDLRASLGNHEPALEPVRRNVVLDRLTMLNSLIEAFHVKQSSENEYELEGDENNPRLDSSHCELGQRVDINEAALTLLKEYLPVLSAVANRYRDDTNIIDVVTSTTKRCCRSLGVEVKPVLESLLKLIVLSYDPLSNPQLLDGLLPVYNLFKKDASVQAALQEAFRVISEQTLQACMGTPLQNLSITIEVYFRFATLICKRFTDFLTDHQFNQNVQLIYKLAVKSLELPEKRTLVEACNFLQQFRAKSIGVNELHNIVLANLDQLATTIFGVMGGIFSTPRNAVDPVCDVLFAIIDTDEIREPLKQIVARPQFPTEFVGEQQKARFVQMVVHERNRRKFKDLCAGFVLTARNLHRK